MIQSTIQTLSPKRDLSTGEGQKHPNRGTEASKSGQKCGQKCNHTIFGTTKYKKKSPHKLLTYKAIAERTRFELVEP